MLDALVFDGFMPRLKILRASGNRLGVLDTSFVSNLRTLYLDNNMLMSLTKIDRLTKLENLSLRNQNGERWWVWSLQCEGELTTYVACS